MIVPPSLNSEMRFLLDSDPFPLATRAGRGRKGVYICFQICVEGRIKRLILGRTASVRSRLAQNLSLVSPDIIKSYRQHSC